MTDHVSRRAILAAAAAGTSAFLAGCKTLVDNERLQVEVTRFETVSDGFKGELAVRNGGSGDPEPDADYSSSYDDVRVLGYDHERQEVLNVAIGDLGPREGVEREFSADGFPLVITADAAGVDTDGLGLFVETGARVYGYYGDYDSEDDTPRRYGSGHIWGELTSLDGVERSEHASRSLDDDLPPPEESFDVLKCLHRQFRDDEETDPDFSIVPDSEEWLDREFPDPTIHRQNWFEVDEDLGSRVSIDEPVSVAFDDLPTVLRDAFREERHPDWMDEETFLETVSALADEEFEAHDDLPSCSEPHVGCADNRKERCDTAPGYLVGTFRKVIRYVTEHEGERRDFVATYDDRLSLPDADPLPACTDERDETHTVVVYRRERLTEEQAKRPVETVPEVAQGYVDELEGGNYREEIAAAEFTALVSALEGAEADELPECESAHVDCWREPRLHCGRGGRTLWYDLPDSSEAESIALEYEWERRSDSE